MREVPPGLGGSGGAGAGESEPPSVLALFISGGQLSARARAMHRGTSGGCLSLVRLCLPSAGAGAGGKGIGAGGGGRVGSLSPPGASP
eukprot:5734170-Pyramimonas_sp.AAC.1